MIGRGIDLTLAERYSSVNDSALMNWVLECDGGLKPSYFFLNMKRETVTRWKGDLFVRFDQMDLGEVDHVKLQQVWSKRQSVRNRNRQWFTLVKALVCHDAECAHMYQNLLPGIVSPVFTMKEADSKVQELFFFMYQIEKVPAKPLRECWGCWMVFDVGMKQCPCMRGIWFCSVGCQRKHWGQIHHRECGTIVRK